MGCYTEMLCEARGMPAVRALEELAAPPACLHVQHETGLFDVDHLERLIAYCRQHGVRLLVTVHTTFPFSNSARFWQAQRLWQPLRLARRVAVGSARRLPQGLKDRLKPLVAAPHPGVPLADASRPDWQTQVALNEPRFVRELAPLESQRLIARHADGILVHTQAAREAWLRMGARPAQVRIVPFPVPRHATSPVRHSQSDGRLHVGCFGFLEARRNLDYVIDACARVGDVVLHVFASRREAESSRCEGVAARAARTPWVQHCSDFLSNAELVMELSRCDVNVWSHQPHPQIISSSGSIRQLLAAGRPIVATDNPMIDDVRHLLTLVPVADTERLTEALRSAPQDDPRIAAHAAAYAWDREAIAAAVSPAPADRV